MPLPATVVWQAWAGGSPTNGGGFVSSYGGTDYSQQLSPQVSVTDAACAGNTTVTSASATFTSLMVGNLICLNTLWYVMTAFVDAHTITIHTNGPNGSGYTLKLGGAIAPTSNSWPHQTILVGGHKTFLRGVLTPSATPLNASASGTATQPIVWEGCTTTPGDGGFATIQAPGTIQSLICSGNDNIWKNVIFDGQAGTHGNNPMVAVTGAENEFYNCVMKNSDYQQLWLIGDKNRINRCYIALGTGSHGDLVSVNAIGNVLEWCTIAGNGNGTPGSNGTGSGLTFFGTGQGHRIENCIIRNQPYEGIYLDTAFAGQVTFKNCDIWCNGRDGMRIYSSAGAVHVAVVQDSIFGRNASYDANMYNVDVTGLTGTPDWFNTMFDNNAFFTTGTGRYNHIPASTGDLALSANPFVNDAIASGFTLNNVVGGGALLQSNPVIVNYPDGNTGKYLVGALGIAAATTTVASAVAGVAPVIDEVQFPTQISEGASGGPTFSTVVIVGGNGLEQRVPIYTHGRYQWNAATGMKSPTDMALVTAFWLARQGRARGFRWKDWDDYKATAQTLLPDGTPTIQLSKAYVSGAITYNRVIYKPVAGTVSLTRGGSAYAAYALDTTTGIITWSPINQKSITAITAASSAVVTVGASHGFVGGDVVYFTGVLGMTQINGLVGTITSTTSTTITVNINSSAFTAYTSGGTATKYVQPADTITWTGQFDVPVRFDTDIMQMTQESSQIRHWDNLPIIELTGG
jgi:uncharacterized protein (TIGR02217 family)